MKRPLSEESSRKIVNLSFLCAVLICAVHVQWVPPNSGGDVLLFCRKCMGDPALNFFFIVSGFFLAWHFGESGWWASAIRKRIGTILIPYAVWQFVNAVAWFAVDHRWVLRLGNFGLNPFVYPMLDPLWYLRNLMLLVVASPMIFACLKRWGKSFLAAVFVAGLAAGCLMETGGLSASSRLGGFLRTTFTLQGLFMFCLGAYLAMHPMSLSRRAGRWCGVAALVLVFARFALFYLKVPVPFDVVIPASLLALAFAWTHMPAFRLPKALARSVFPIYLMHAIILQTVFRQIFPWSLFTPIEEILLGVGGSIVIAELLHRGLPCVARFAFGGR